MINSRTGAVILGSAALGLVAATTSPANAHPGPRDTAPNADLKSKDHARTDRAHRRARGARRCTIAPAKLLTTNDSDRLYKLDERLDARVADGDITQAKADRRSELIQKRVTIKVAMRTAGQAPVLTLFAVKDAAALRTAITDAGGVRALIDATEGVEVADFRTARRQGRRDARDARAELCSSGESSGETPQSTPSA